MLHFSVTPPAAPIPVNTQIDLRQIKVAHTTSFLLTDRLASRATIKAFKILLAARFAVHGGKDLLEIDQLNMY